MWYTKLLSLVFPTATFGLNQETLKFSINYFQERNVPFICLISCDNVSWDVKFTKAASNYSMLVSRLDDGDLSHVNMKQCFRQLFSTIGVLINTRCADREQIFYPASENMWLDSNHIWLIVDEQNLTQHNENPNNATIYKDSEYSSKTLDVLNNLNISVDADIILAIQNGKQFKLYDIFNFGKVLGGALNISEAGLWTDTTNNEVISKLNNYKYYKRWNFGQHPLRMISVTTSPNKNFDLKLLSDVQPVPGISTITRASTMAFVVVADIHNIKFVYTITDRWLGSYDKNASRVVATALYFREQDVTSVLRIQKSLIDRVTFIQPSLTYLETRYYYRIPTTGPGKFENQFLRPLSPGTWSCLVGVSALCTLILMLAARLEVRPFSVQYAVFSVTASICQQFFEDDSQSNRISAARKLTLLVTGLSCVLIYNYYTSSVVSWLLNGPPPSINSLEELLESPLELIYQDAGYTRTWLNTPGYYYNRRNVKVEDKLRQKVLSKKRATPVTQTLEDGIAMVKAGGYAYHTETYNADALISQTFDQSELCELGSLGSMEKTLLYPSVQRNSPYKEFLTWSLTRLLERGFISCIQHRTTPRPVSCEGSSPRALALGGAAPAFILLAFGFILGTGIMFVERYIYKMKHGTRNNTQRKFT